MNDDGEPQTVRHQGQLVTTWKEASGRFRVHIDTANRRAKGAITADKLMDPGCDRLAAYEYAKYWIGRHCPQSL